MNPKWDYLYVQAWPLDDEATQKELDKASESGWELAFVAPYQALNGHTRHGIYFKRPGKN